jgi:hypothetical protein
MFSTQARPDKSAQTIPNSPAKDNFQTVDQLALRAHHRTFKIQILNVGEASYPANQETGL